MNVTMAAHSVYAAATFLGYNTTPLIIHPLPTL